MTVLDIPANLTEPYSNFTSVVRVQLNGSDYVVGTNLTMTVEIDSSPTLKNHINRLFVTPQNALPLSPQLVGPSSLPQFLAFQLAPDPHSNAWTGRANILYRVPGSFGLTIEFYNTTVLLFKIRTDPLYTIGSQDVIIAKHNEALTTSLTFLILVLAALDLRIANHGEQSNDKENNGKRDNDCREKSVDDIRRIESRERDQKPSSNPESEEEYYTKRP